ncbi:MAG: beta-ketoacyl-ACP synthase II [Nitrospirota bacterium]|nr:beta-ketoacyl-ACP synthase II [Nitrospirota bacterium]
MGRVTVTGIGAVSPLGNTFKESWGSIKAGRSGLGPVNSFDTHDVPWKVAGELKDFDAGDYLSKNEINRLDRFVQYAVAASIMAAEDTGLFSHGMSSADRLSAFTSGGVIIGSSRGGIGAIEKALLQCRGSNTVNGNRGGRLSPYLMPSTTISMASSAVALKLGIKGYCLGISNACASGANAIGEAYRLIKTGYKGPVLAGGAESPVCRFCIEGYGITGALSKGADRNASRPFDRSRDGFVLSEGACILVLEDYESALARGADIYGEIIGYGNSTDAFHITRPKPSGEANAITMAIKEAGIRPEEVDHINAHGTATRLGDIAEAEAIGMAFGERAPGIPVTAAKSMTGHMLAASGAFEIAATLMAIREGVIPPTINLDVQDPACNLNIVQKKTESEIKIAISNSFGFGGVNAVIVLRGIL